MIPRGHLRFYVCPRYRLSHLPDRVPLSITHEASSSYVAPLEWALAPRFAGDGADEAGLPIQRR